jgi:RHS repeat-associated protein
MGKVTALYLDTITDKSGHTQVGFAVSVCLTPAAPVPLPIPYPTFGTVMEGVDDPCMRTKIENAKILTVGGSMSKCHGNEPGTLKEVVSLNTTGPCFPWLGAPIVFIELGMAGITGSMGQMNKMPIGGLGANASGAGGAGSGGGAGGSSAGGPGQGGPGGGSNAGGGGGGGNSGAAPPSPPASPSAEGQANAGHPVDVVTGALYTSPVTDLSLQGAVTTALRRSYSSAAVGRDAGLGWGWSHDLDWTATRSGDQVEITGPGARTFALRYPADDEVVCLRHGTRVRRSGLDLVVDVGDGLYRLLRPAARPDRYALAEIRDATGNATEIAWEHGQVVGLLDAVGRRATRRSEGPYRIWDIAVDDEHGVAHTRRAVTYELDERGDLVCVIDAGGAESRFAYDEEHYLVREALADGLVYHFRHEVTAGVKRCVETWGELPGGDVLAALGRVWAPSEVKGVYHTRLVFDPAARSTVVTDGLGQTHLYAGNALGQVERYTDPRGYVRQYHYDATGNLLGVVDGAGRVTRRSFDGAGRPTGYVNSDGSAWRQSFDDEASTVVLTRPDGLRDAFRHARGALVEHVDPAGRKTTIGRDEKGAVASVVRGESTFGFTYDAHGNLRRVTRPDGGAYEYTFDLFGCPTVIKSARGVEYRLSYDSRDDLVLFEEPGGKKTEYEIDAARRVTGRREAGGTTTFAYVGSALTETRRADGRRYRQGHDALFRLRWIENPAGERYAREYDGSGNVAQETSFAGVVTRYEHDGSNRMVRVERSDGSWARFERDHEGRLVLGEYSDGLTERFRYDAMGQIVRAESGASSLVIERDHEGRATREVQETGGFRFEVKRAFDALGNVDARAYSTGWGVTMKRRPEDGTLLSLRAVAAEPETIAFAYDARGEETSRRRIEGRGAVRTERDVHGLPTRVAVQGEDERQVLRERTYAWSPLGPLAAMEDSRYGSRRYELDPEGRPLAVEGLGPSERFDFAPQGTAVPAGDPSWSIGRDGRPVAARGDRLTWDARGRLARREGATPVSTWDYGYDDRDRLVRATRGDGPTLRYVYDALGRRVATVHDDGQSTWFGWDGDTIVEEQLATGARTQRVFGDDGFTPVLEARDGKDWRMVVADGAGTPWLYLHQDLSLSELELTTWGTVARQSGDPGAMRFAGQRADETTGLHYNRNRYYAPDLHVYLTPDPMGIEASLQDVGFVRNVTIYIDPLGLTIIVNADPNDPVISGSTARLQAAYPGATVLRYDQLTPGSLAGENHVIVNSHGYPGGINWGNQQVNGQQLGDALSRAGFRGGSKRKVDITACNSATPQQGGGPSTAQAVANRTGATTQGAMSNNPQTTYAGTTAVGPGGYQWGPGMLSTNGTQTPYVHDGTWATVKPNTFGGRVRGVWGNLF